MKRIFFFSCIFILLFFNILAVSDYNNISMSLSTNPGGGGYVIEPKEDILINNVILHTGVNSNNLVIKDSSNNQLYGGINDNINITLNKNSQYKIYVDSNGQSYNRYYATKTYPFETEYIKYISGWHNGLQTQQNNAFNIIGFNLNEYQTTQTPEIIKKDVWVLIGQSNCNGQGNTLNQLIGGSTSKVYNLNDEYLEASDKNFNVNLNHQGTIFPLLSNHLYQNHNYSIDYIMTCVSGSRIDQWMNESINYNKMLGQVSEFTNGTNKVKGVIMIQGEAEAHQQNVNNYDVGYNEYKNYLNSLIINLNNDLDIESNKMFITIIDRNDTNTNHNYLNQIQNAQLDSISENENISLFADMRGIGAQDNVHFMSDYEIGTFAQKGYDNIKNQLFVDSNIVVYEPEEPITDEIIHNMNISLSDEENICLNQNNINLIDIIKLMFMYLIYGGNN